MQEKHHKKFTASGALYVAMHHCSALLVQAVFIFFFSLTLRCHNSVNNRSELLQTFQCNSGQKHNKQTNNCNNSTWYQSYDKASPVILLNQMQSIVDMASRPKEALAMTREKADSFSGQPFWPLRRTLPWSPGSLGLGWRSPSGDIYCTLSCAIHLCAGFLRSPPRTVGSPSIWDVETLWTMWQAQTL